jgi:hypothetical protein
MTQKVAAERVAEQKPEADSQFWGHFVRGCQFAGPIGRDSMVAVLLDRARAG